LQHHVTTLLAGTSRSVLQMVTGAALITLAAALMTACSSNPPTTPAVGTGTAPPVEATRSVVVEITPTQAQGDGNVEARVTEFEAWQDYMPVVPKEGAPLYGVVTVEITHTEKITPQNTEGTVTLIGDGGDTVASGVRVTLQQQSDDLGLLAPGPQTVTFNFGPATTQLSLAEGDMLKGTLGLNVDGATVQLPLPEIALYFTH
jgi:hypothetical protein